MSSSSRHHQSTLHATIRQLLEEGGGGGNSNSQAARAALLEDPNDFCADETKQTLLCQRILYHFQQQQKQQQQSSSNDTSRTPNLEESSVSENENDDDGDSPNDENNFLRTKRHPVASSSLSLLSTKTNLREFLGDNLSSTKIAQLTSILAELMSSRVDTEQCLPMTYDEQANEEAMQENYSSCITLTRTALVAGTLYASLAALPGALATGFCDLHALAALVALLKRWKLEIAHSSPEKTSSSLSSNNTTTTQRSKPNKHGKRRDISENDDAVDAPIKRSRKDDESSDTCSSDEEQDDEDAMAAAEIQTALTQAELQTMGLRIAQQLAILPLQKEFMSWSCEAREAVLDATTAVLATSSALLAAKSSSTLAAKRALNINNNKELASLAESTVTRASSAMVKCIILDPTAAEEDDDDDIDDQDDSDDDDDDDNIILGTNHGSSSSATADTLTKRHETTVYILRGILPALLFREEQPNGEAGKQAAAEKASRVLSSLIQEVTDDISLHKHRWPSCMNSPPLGAAAGRRVTFHGTTLPGTTPGPNNNNNNNTAMKDASTPRTARKTRVSFGSGVNGGGTRRHSIDFSCTPKLKTPAASKGSTGTSRRGSLTTGGRGLNTPSLRINGQPRPVLTALLGAVQKLATHSGLDKAGPRTLAVETMERCLVHFPSLERHHLLKFLIRQCHSKVSTHRLVACQVIGLVLDQSWLWTEHASSSSRGLTTPATELKSSTPLVLQSEQNMPAALFGALQGRLVDRVSTVRAACFTAMTNVLVGLYDTTGSQMDEKDESSSPSSIGLAQVLEAQALSLVDCFRRRAAVDEKATVRKTAVTALAQLLLVGEFIPAVRLSITHEDIVTLAQRCSDSSTLTRKAAAEALTRLLQGYTKLGENGDDEIMNVIKNTWTTSVLPLVLDGETSCNSKAIELVDRIVLAPILSENDGQNEDVETSNFDTSSTTAWSILASIGSGPGGQGASPAESEALRKALVHRVETSDNPKNFVKVLVLLIQQKATVSLKNHNAIVVGPNNSPLMLLQYLQHEQRAGVWSLFNSLVHACNDIHNLDLAKIIKRSKIDLGFLGSSWEAMLRMSSSCANPRAAELLRCSMQHSLQVISMLAPCVDIEIIKQTLARLLELLSTFALPEATIGAAITALTSLTVSSSSADGGDRPQQRKLCADWVQSIFTTCQEEMLSCVDIAPVTRSDTMTLLRALFTVGEVSMVGFSPSDDEDAGSRNNDERADDTWDLSMNVRGMHVKPKKQLVELVQTFCSTFMPGSTGNETPVPEAIRAHAFIALGKLCLRDEALAKSSLNVLARELHENMSQNDGGSWSKNSSKSSPTVQSNALLVLGDLCVRYTSLTDKYLPAMGACMQSGTTDLNNNLFGMSPSKDRFVLVRRHAVILLSSLIMQDYIKWRGLLFFRFLVASTDEDESVADLAQAALCGPLLDKQPKLFVNQFVASFFVLNRCQAHPMYVAAAATGDGGSGVTVGFEGINLTGEVGQVRRIQMYELMLSKMSDEQKMHVIVGITKEILGGALIEGSDLYKACTVRREQAALYESAARVMTDAFTILQSPMIRVGKAASSSREEDDLDESTASAANGNARARFVVSTTVAMGRLMSNLNRQQVIEHVLPILVNLKAVLQHHRSPLLKNLMEYLVKVFRMYKAEVKKHLTERNDGDSATLLQEIEYDARRSANQEDVPNSGSATGDASDSRLDSFNKSLYVSRDESQDQGL